MLSTIGAAISRPMMRVDGQVEASCHVHWGARHGTTGIFLYIENTMSSSLSFNEHVCSQVLKHEENC
jgi:hypothetical protein